MGAAKSHPSRRCSARTVRGRPCRNRPVAGSDPPRCHVHAPRALAAIAPGHERHAFYGRSLTAQEIADLLAHAERMSLDDELAVTRVTLRRLMELLQDPDLSRGDLTAVASLVFSGARTVAQLLRQMGSGQQGLLWDQILDQLAEQLDADL